MIDFAEILNGDDWELFARDFFSALGFVVELDPSRGADGGKDFIISEQVKGLLHTQKFKWLVSCKHFTVSGKAVGVSDENDIQDRLSQHGCDGFIGFYSTLGSSALLDRLAKLKEEQKIKDYTIYDKSKIQGYFFNMGFSRLAYRYFPKSYTNMRPIQKIVDEEVLLKCEICGCDWVKESIAKPYDGIIVSTYHKDSSDKIDDVFVVCKGDCDDRLQKHLKQQGRFTRWEDVGDLFNPLGYLKNILTYMNILHEREDTYTEQAHDKQKMIYIALAQRVLREISDEERKRVIRLSVFEGF